MIDAEDDAPSDKRAATKTVERSDTPRLAIGAAVAVGLVLVAVAVLVTLPTGNAAVDGDATRFDPRGLPGGVAASSAFPRPTTPSPSGAIATTLVVDVEGAIVSPGVHELPYASRVGEAIAAAGGYAANVDIAAAARSLNLAAVLQDGQQIRVPALGDSAAIGPMATSATGPSGSSGGLIDLNNATADELDTLPGVGPVTAQKIIDARAETPFTTADELQSRGVVGPSTFEKLRELVTVAP